MTLHNGDDIAGANAELDALGGEVARLRERLTEDDEATTEDARILEAAWDRVQSRWLRLCEANDAAFDEARGAYEDAAARLRGVLNARYPRRVAASPLSRTSCESGGAPRVRPS